MCGDTHNPPGIHHNLVGNFPSPKSKYEYEIIAKNQQWHLLINQLTNENKYTTSLFHEYKLKIMHKTPPRKNKKADCL